MVLMTEYCGKIVGIKQNRNLLSPVLHLFIKQIYVKRTKLYKCQVYFILRPTPCVNQNDKIYMFYLGILI